ncbi:hypothetical protein HGA91_04755 [candidate division WWE3 bacterium]|nr:hypothetical protein [candidate division WWE3 bacterium]
MASHNPKVPNQQRQYVNQLVSLAYIGIGFVLPGLVKTIINVFFPENYTLSWVGYTLQTPLAFTLVAYLLTMMFKKEQRKTIFVLLFLGALAYWVYDAALHPYKGTTFWLFPINFNSVVIRHNIVTN